MAYFKTAYNKLLKYLSTDYLFVHLLLIYIYSRIIYKYVFGIGFNELPLNFAVQYIDPVLLTNNLLESIYYLHSQPPLFNLFLGIVLKLFPQSYPVVFHIIYLVMGLLFVGLTYRLLLFLNVSQKISFIILVLFIVNPSFILYENILFYTHPLLFALILSLYLLFQFLRNNSSIMLFVFFFVSMIISLTHGFFHLIWFASLIIILITVRQRETKKILLTSMLPLIIILSVYFKNYFLFDQFSASSWLGMNIAKITTFQIPKAERDSLVDVGNLTWISQYQAFPEISEEAILDSLHIQNTGIKVLDQITRSTNRPNYNNLGYLELSILSKRDAFFTLEHRFGNYLAGVKASTSLYFSSPSDYKLLSNNRKKIKAWDNLFDSVVYGEFNSHKKPGYFSVIILPLLIIFGLYTLVKNYRLNKFNDFPNVILLFIIFNILYVTFIGNLLEYGENNRFRFVVDPLYLILAGLMIQKIIQIIKKAKQGINHVN